MHSLKNTAFVASTVGVTILLGVGAYRIFRFALDTTAALESYVSPALKAGLVAGLLGVLLIAAALHWNASRRSADTLRLEKARLYGQLLETLPARPAPTELERQLALFGGGAVIRAWRELNAEATPERTAKLVQAMRRELGQGSLGFGEDALLELLGAAHAERTSTPLESGATS